MSGFIYPNCIYLYQPSIDFRKSINGLVLLVEQELGRNPFDSTLYIFSNKTKDKLKCLYWDITGFALWYKRLEKERFKWPKQSSLKNSSITPEQFQWLLQGYDIVGHSPLIFKAAS